ncbi:hypothetical protein HHI36_017041 [Cryptolaemus montrouzieri]|uniref:GPI ethanolamine phosphate transferase 1 n=1 Tax=Cryptolaemus montrouzieri TaxID=559131 RepID=A0ABD2NLG4_9CUCU
MVQNICFSLGFLFVITSINRTNVGARTSLMIYLPWVIFLFPIILIPFSMSDRSVRVLTIFMGFAPFFMMTTMSYEMLFLTFFSILLILWVIREERLGASENFQRSLMVMVLMFLGYFGIGNLASVSSVDPLWVRIFIATNSPFKIMILILFRHLLPLLYTICVFRIIVLHNNVDLTSSFGTITLLSDIMALYFLHSVKNSGSWAEMGASLAHFVIADSLTMGLLCFYIVAYFLIDIQVTINFMTKII